jgi:hypothetical protein
MVGVDFEVGKTWIFILSLIGSAGYGVQIRHGS